MSGWLRYPRIIAICWRAGVSAELEYRAGFASDALMSLFWMGWAAAGASVYFQFTRSLAGWTYPELLVVIGMFFAVNGVRQLLFEPNLERMGEYVRRGTLDFLLTRPVDAQLLVSLRHLGVQSLFDPLLGLCFVAAGVALSGRGTDPGRLAAFALTAAAAVALLYALMLTLMALSVLLVGAEELGAISFGAVELARFPVSLYREPLQTVLTLVPVAFFTTVPALALLGRLDPRLLVASPVVAGAAVALATLAWRRALRSYTGASS